MKADIYTQDGKKSGSIELPEAVFGVRWNNALVHQVVVAMQANARTSVAHTKDRSDVKGGGKKPWKQKGLGRARHGSSRSPIWRGGGVTFGPRNEKVYAQKINRKMGAQALFSVLSKKIHDGEVLFVDTLTLDAPKTNKAKEILSTLAGITGFEALLTKKHNAAYIVLPESDAAIARSFSNFGNLKVGHIRNLNPVDALTYKHIIVVNPEQALTQLLARTTVARGTATPTK